MKSTLYSALIIGVSGIVLSACTQPPAQVVDKGKSFFGKVEYADNTYIRMPQNPVIASKYKDANPQYDVAAPLDTIQASTLDAPEPVTLTELPPLAAQPAPREMAALPSSLPTPQPSAEKVVQRTVAKPSYGAAAMNTQAVARESMRTQDMRAEPAGKTSFTPPEQVAVVKPEPRLSPLPMDTAALETVLEKQPPILDDLNERSSNFVWPTEGRVVSKFGPKTNGLVNDGINIEATEGGPIWAAADGEVVYAGNELKGYGNMMIIRHANGWMTAYAHASDMLITKGDKVGQGDLIGYVGKTGSVKTAQLHFGIREGKKPVDPESLLPRRMAAAN